MNLIDKAIKRITEECEGKDYLIPFEEYLTSICTNDSVAEKILSPRKTLQECFNGMKNIARKSAINNFAFIPTEVGYQIIREYYDITIE